MTSPKRAAVWLDHHEARIFHVDLDSFDERRLQAPQHRLHRHPRDASQTHAHPEDETRFFADVAHQLGTADEVLVLGPSTAKTQLLNYLNRHAPRVAAKVVAVETADHPSDSQLVAHIRSHFRIPEPRVQ